MAQTLAQRRELVAAVTGLQGLEQGGFQGAKRMNVLNEWAFVGLFAVMAPVFPALPIVIAWLFRPRKPNVLKSSTYECGVETIGDTWVQFRVQYYIYGLIFLVFDVEMVFLFPWAVAYNEMSLFGFVAGFLFIFLLTDALFYAWKKNALDWK